jgi:hypothetical protein
MFAPITIAFERKRVAIRLARQGCIPFFPAALLKKRTIARAQGVS